MINDIYEPLDEYVNVFRDRFNEVCSKTFEELAAEASVDVEANRDTCAKISDTELIISDIKKQIVKWTIPCVLLWIVFGVGVIFAIVNFVKGNIGLGIGVCAVALIVLWLLLSKIHPKLNSLKQERDNLQKKCDDLRNEAWKQMEPLNRLYDWDVFTRMMSRTVPRLEFDPYFTSQRLEDLKVIYNWDESFNEGRSVLFSHSGLINGNPFVFCRTKKMEWGEKEYTGKLTIHWTETERGSDGKYRTVERSETLEAKIKRPIPEYYHKTRLIYGNIAAPDLTFHRKKSARSSKVGSLAFMWKKGTLHRKANRLRDNDYAMMSNEDFEVAFDTSNRNNNHQFALLFTPLAQNSMLSLLSNYETGYGDDFDFEKDHMINVITADHMQSTELDMNPAQYQSYNFDKASEDFCKINAAHFRALYFAFAPLLCVPMYQQIRSHEDIYGRDMKRESSFWEHEALANFWGVDKFKHPECVTDCILKTSKGETTEKGSTINVTADGYRTKQRCTYVSKRGGDGLMHDVPVYWDEYINVIGQGQFLIKEDNTSESDVETHTQRVQRIENLLSDTGHSLYRRHISSGI